MLEKDRERLLSKIIAGRDRLILNNNGSKEYFWLINPSPIDRLIASDVYDEAIAESSLYELYTEEESIELLKIKGFWSDKEEEDLKTAIKNLDNLKVGLYKSIRRRDREAAKEGINRTKRLITDLSNKKYKLASFTIEWYASSIRTKYLVGKCLLRKNGEHVWSNDDFLSDSSSLLDEAFRHFVVNKLNDSHIRDLSRNEPWRSIWTCKSIENSIFGIPASHLSDDQKAIIAWSRLYDSCYEDPQRPSDEVVNDDDMFDGWLIDKRREREAEIKKTKVESALSNEKIASANEVFILGSNPGEDTSGFTKDEIEEIEDMNSPEAASIKKMRMNEIMIQGELPECKMPDTKVHIQNTLTRMAMAKNNKQ